MGVNVTGGELDDASIVNSSRDVGEDRSKVIFEEMAIC
jgi:hypothetical protein